MWQNFRQINVINTERQMARKKDKERKKPHKDGMQWHTNIVSALGIPFSQRTIFKCFLEQKNMTQIFFFS